MSDRQVTDTDRLFSIGMGFVPINSEIGDVSNVLSGKDCWTGEEQSRLWGIAGLLSPFVGGSSLEGGFKSTWDWLSARFSNGGAKASFDHLNDRQRAVVETIDNLINDHLKPHDFTGAERDLQGNPVPRKGGGYYNHLQEMVDTLIGLKNARRKLSGALKNPNLAPDVRQTLQIYYDKSGDYIRQINELFSKYNYNPYKK
ncbi:polymorphic toxin type 28 domain-containing protein [Lihuaxuella thermophila]|uniref:Toxin 28 n=1 Tax=Lihuaxuella thermophila TaxID=1173111 RepID=A0A1H8B5D5_9BACL|nr:polymorphic toxin type 28 domain-containing protein [Lihuaxuella thermophila]SEM77963.1 toxin 28 [Lihuaxuella thermophila]